MTGSTDDLETVHRYGVPMRVILVRHAVTGETGSSLTGRLAGVALSADGIAMAEELAASLSGLALKAIYSSPIQRCRETAAILAREHRLPVRTRSAFVEADYGAWSGRSLKSLYRLKAWGMLMSAPSRFRFPDGETLAEVQARAVAGVETLAAAHSPGDVVVVCSHNDVIRVVLAHYLGVPLDLVHRLDARPASVSIIDLAKNGRVAVPVVNQDRTGTMR